MCKKSKILVLIIILSLSMSFKAKADTPTPNDCTPKYNSTLINSLYLSSTTKLEDIIQRLDAVESDTDKNYTEVKNHLEDTNRRMKLLLNEQTEVKNQLKVLDTELSTINTIKKKVQRDIDKNKETKSN